MKINVRENHYIFAILSGRPCIQGDYLNLGAVPVGHIEILGGGGAGGGSHYIFSENIYLTF